MNPRRSDKYAQVDTGTYLSFLLVQMYMYYKFWTWILLLVSHQDRPQVDGLVTKSVIWDLHVQ